MRVTDDWPVAREGVWLYANTVPVKVRILSSAETWGTGDHEDDSSVRENQPIPCFFLAYEMAGAPGNFCNLVPNLETLESAMTHAEERLPGMRWLVQAEH